MSMPAAEAHARALRDAGMTADRVELKFLVARKHVPCLLMRLAHRLPRHRFEGEGATRLPDAQHFVSTIYFDTASHVHLRAASENGSGDVKVRARAYYDLHAGLAELATRADQIVHEHPWLFLEIKRRTGTRTQKARLRLAREELHAFIAGTKASEPEAAQLALELRALGELVPSCVVNYRRVPFQDSAGNLRITLDLDIASFPVPPQVWTRTCTFVRGSLGTPAALEPHALLEVKSRGELPCWLTQLLAQLTLETTHYSKFVAAGRAVHGLG
jgi:hypothetical protein